MYAIVVVLLQLNQIINTTQYYRSCTELSKTLLYILSVRIIFFNLVSSGSDAKAAVLCVYQSLHIKLFLLHTSLKLHRTFKFHAHVHSCHCGREERHKQTFPLGGNWQHHFNDSLRRQKPRLGSTTWAPSEVPLVVVVTIVHGHGTRP